jgi:hypothetical protein
MVLLSKTMFAVEMSMFANKTAMLTLC